MHADLGGLLHVRTGAGARLIVSPVIPLVDIGEDILHWPRRIQIIAPFPVKGSDSCAVHERTDLLFDTGKLGADFLG